jgi:hypothetical protein
MNRVFFPQALLDVLMDLGKVDLAGDDLIIQDEPYSYKALEAVRVLVEVTTGEDPHGICGKVSPRSKLTDEMGAEILGNSMLVEDNAYDVIPGFIGEPIGDVDPAVEAGKTETDVLAKLQNVEDLL